MVRECFVKILKSVAIPLTIIACGTAPKLTVEQLYTQYLAAGNHKAYAISRNGFAGASWNQPTIEAAKKNAMSGCLSVGGYDCKIASVDGYTDPAEVSGSDPDEGEGRQTRSPEREPNLTRPELVSTSTGFFVTSNGDVLTNAHAVDKCDTLSIRFGGEDFGAIVKAVDTENDLALLATQATDTEFAKFSENRRIRLGEPIIVFGFPLSSVLSSHPKITEGSISSLAGLGDDTRYYQISAPVQPGSSGGPLFDEFGAVIGLVTSKLSDAWMVKNVGVVPQNINFALKFSSVKTFLEVQDVHFALADLRDSRLTTPDLADRALKITAQLACWN